MKAKIAGTLQMQDPLVQSILMNPSARYPVRQNLDCKEVGDPFEWLTILALCSRRSICKKTCKDNYQKRGPVYCKPQLASISESSTPPMKLHKSCLVPGTGKLHEIAGNQSTTMRNLQLNMQVVQAMIELLQDLYIYILIHVTYRP